MAAGDFSSSVLLQIKLKAEQMWADGRLSADKKANAAAAVAVKENSTARMTQLSDPGKENTVRVNFLNPCAVAVQDCTTDCDISGPEIESGGKDYALDLCKEVPFSVNAEKTRTNTYTVEEEAAEAMAFAIKALDEWWAQQVLVKLKAFSGINVSPLPYTYAAGTTTIPNASYNLSIIAEIMNDALLNKMGSNTYYINNGDLWVAYTNALLNSGNAEGKGDAERIKQLRMYFDQWNFGPAGVTESIFAVSPSAIAFTTKNRHSDQPVKVEGTVQQTRYTVPSSVIPGVKYDAFYSLKCITTNGVENLVHSWKLKTRGGIFLNPEGCPVVISAVTYLPTGVLSYTHGA
jgi:hypothetical protein